MERVYSADNQPRSGLSSRTSWAAGRARSHDLASEGGFADLPGPQECDDGKLPQEPLHSTQVLLASNLHTLKYERSPHRFQGIHLLGIDARVSAPNDPSAFVVPLDGPRPDIAIAH